jgi:class 3 adenylate cyclase
MEQPVAWAWQGDRREPLALSSYVSELATRRLAGRHEPLREPGGEQLAAAVLFADISGFTALTERLAQTGPSGVEELTELLNGCFGQLVELVADHGGDVVKFAGDALLALWAADEDLPTLTAQAASCGLAMQQVLRAGELAAGTRLSMRIGVGAGRVSAAHLGGERGRWEFVVGGPAVMQTCGVEQLARPGDVLLSPEALDQVRDLCAGEQMPVGTGQAWVLRVTTVQPLAAAAPPSSVPTPQAAGAALRGYVPGAIVARLAAGQSAWLSELRHVSVLFLRLPDLDDITPSTLRWANDLVCGVQETLYEYEGSLNKLGVDDKGATLVAAFGLPPVAHEDDPVRAVRAALGIQANLRRLGVRYAIGIATGRVFCGSVGSNLRREYTMIGGVVNLAARLMQTVSDDVVCDIAYQEAVLFLTAALERDPPPPQDGNAEARFRRARWERQLAEAHLGLGDTGEGRVHLGRALELLGTPLPATSGQLAGSVLRQLALQAFHRVFPDRTVGRGQRPEDSLEASRAYMRLTEVFWFANNVPSLVHAGIQALNLAERAGPSPELARAYSIMCLAAGRIPIHPLARAYARRAEQTARRTGQLWPLGYVRFITCVYKIGAARWAELHEALEEAKGLLEQAGDRRALGDALTVQAMSSLYRGEFRRAAAGFDDVHQRGRRDENIQHQVWGLLGKAECLLRAGRLDEAARLLVAALALLTDHPDQAERLRACGLLAVVRLREGDAQAAQQAAQTVARLVAKLRAPTAHYLLEGYAGVAEVYLSLWETGQDSSDTRRAARQACRALRRFARVFPIGKARARLYQGRLAQLSGQAERARAAWRASLAAAERLGMPFEAALAHSELGRHAVGELQGQWHLEQAETLLQELGIASDSIRKPDPTAEQA